MKLPLAPGRYVAASGELHAVHPHAACELARNALRAAGVHVAEVRHWDGRRWTDTGRKLYARGAAPLDIDCEVKGYLGPPPDSDRSAAEMKRRAKTPRPKTAARDVYALLADEVLD